MEVNSATTSFANSATSSGSTSTISSDFDMFLTMLTVQMENQDPLNPIDSSDYAVQLATFSGVEQQALTNDLLQDLAAQMSANGISEMAGWVGMEARAAVPAYFDGSEPITLSPNPVAVADQVELVVYDQWGSEVDRQAIPVSEDLMEWSGETATGSTLPSGNYSFALVSYAEGEVLSEDPVDLYTMVTEIRSGPTGTMLVMQGGAEIPAGAVSALRDPDL